MGQYDGVSLCSWWRQIAKQDTAAQVLINCDNHKNNKMFRLILITVIVFKMGQFGFRMQFWAQKMHLEWKQC